MLSVWVGCDQKGPSIFLIFKNVNKHDVLFTNIVSKVVTDFGMGLIFFKLRVAVHYFRNYPIYVGFFNLW